MSKRAASPSLDEPNAKCTRNQISPLSDGDESPQVDDNEVIVLDKAQVTESSSSRVHPSSPSCLQDTPASQDTVAWDVSEHFLTTNLTCRNMEAEFHMYLGHHHDPSDWMEARQALFSGDGDNELSLSNLLAVKRKHINKVQSTPSSSSKSCSRPSHKSKNPFIDFEPGQAKVMHLPSRKHTLSDAVARIEESINHSGSIYAQRMYVFTVNVFIRQFITEHPENRGLEIIISPWIPSHIYITSDSPRTILSTFPEQYQSSIKKWDVVKEDKQEAVNMLRLQFPYPAWLRIKRGKYRDAITYLFECEQSNNFVTVLIPPRDFPYIMPKGSIALFDPSRLPTRISPLEILRKGEIYTILATHHSFSGSVTVEFDLDGCQKQIKATLAEIVQVFDVGDEIRVVVGVYSGVEGHIMLKYDENFTICQSSTQEEIKVSKYYLDHRPINCTLQGTSAAAQYVDPPEEAKSIEIGDCIRVTIGDLIGRSGLALWVSGEFVWFQDNNDQALGQLPSLETNPTP
ncbi:hypothetical protein DEU56DRAFT_912041 [Suillus clintonianus]|uniref:uncharacterized protein n=1 Tax=Suillus clintonianus TaxID=1904413 RepID=UPI001B87B860|nr:uncharacterized protein DEU56DRAFT_912041 [Suillus clintonianus]KAG2139776.1 hypothetical protein DEU56DRAFT_912041 [Suillus clintonianus]